MAKNKKTTQVEESAERQSRQSRKEELIQRKNDEQMRIIRIGAAIVIGLILLVIAIAFVNELFIAPNRSVATVNDAEIALADWQDRVVYERAQRVIALDEQLEIFGGDVGIIQQFAGQSINELVATSAEGLGEAVLDAMVDEELVEQVAAERGITVSEADVEARTGEFFNFYGGDSPTPVPTATATVLPTPSVTPIGAAGTEPEPTAEPLPTDAPVPTPTPVSVEAFQEEYATFVANLEDKGAKESVYRSIIASQILREQLIDALTEDQSLSEEAPQASFFALTYQTEEEANAGLAEIQASDYLTVWNSVRSAPAPEAPAEGEEPVIPPNAAEIIWRTQDSVESILGTEAADVVFTQPVNVPGAVLEIPSGHGSVYVVLMVSGREDRPLSQGELDAVKQELLRNFIAEQRANGNVVVDEFWRSRVPVLPKLDPKFLVAPTPAPTAAATAESDSESGAE